MRFFSDNAAAACPAVLDALAEANRLDTAYDGDEWSLRLDGAFSDLFETDVRALWVSTGTAANCIGLATLCPPYGGIICHRDAHIEVDEAGAPGFYTHGGKLILCGISRSIMEIFEITRLDKMLTIVKDEQTGLNSF